MRFLQVSYVGGDCCYSGVVSRGFVESSKI